MLQESIQATQGLSQPQLLHSFSHCCRKSEVTVNRIGFQDGVPAISPQLITLHGVELTTVPARFMPIPLAL